MTSDEEKLRLFELLQEQMAFMWTSNRLFKRGDIPEAKRLATALRVLVHDTASSRSLLSQMGVKDKLAWISSGSVDPANMMATFNLAIFDTSVRGYAPLPATFIQEVGYLVDFETWWSEPIMKDVTGDKFSRREVVLALVNKEGGAHVDKLQQRMRGLASEGSLGLSYYPDGEPSEESRARTEGLVVTSPLPASVSTMATEVYNTFTNQWPLLHPSNEEWVEPEPE